MLHNTHFFEYFIFQGEFLRKDLQKRAEENGPLFGFVWMETEVSGSNFIFVFEGVWSFYD